MNCNSNIQTKRYDSGFANGGRRAAHPDWQVPGMAYVPWQSWGEYYEPCKALERGTMFAVLDKPFKGGRCK